MNYYDKEENIITLLQNVSMKEIYFVNPTIKSLAFFVSLYSEKIFRKWKNNSAKNASPPDFFSEKYKYMLEVMRTDDYVVGSNSPNALESKCVKRIENFIRENKSISLKDSNINLLIIPDMSKASENNYSIYVDNFKRIINKHIKKIENYRKNHPSFRLGFLIFDEAPAYLNVFDPNITIKAGEPVSGFPHFHYLDKNLVRSFEQADVEYVIWMTPYKKLPSIPPIYPEICIFDMKRKNGWKNKLIEYDIDKMVCLEAPY